MGRLFAALLFCALLLTAFGSAQRKPAQPVFFSMLFEQLLPEWTLGRSDGGRGGGGGADMAVSKRGARIVAAALFGLMLLFVFAPTALAAVYWGQSGETVRRVQQKLKQWGYYSGAVDGVFGQGTYDAVIRFQKKNGLRADGVAGAATLAAMGVSEKAAASAVTTAASGYASEVELLARLIHGEARGEPYVGMVAVGAVVLNRVRSSRFPNTLAGRDLSIRRV